MNGESKRDNRKDNEHGKVDTLADKTLQIMRLMEQLSANRDTQQENIMSTPKEHKFWATQPIPIKTESNSMDNAIEDGPVEANKMPNEIRQKPYALPTEFIWCEVSLDDPKEKEELYLLLNKNYVEDIESLFRFDYPAQFLEWALKAPRWSPSWHVGVRVRDTKKLVAFISAIPIQLKVRGKEMSAVEVNFLCIHKKLRSKRLAPLMIREITRRVHLHGIFQALYTAGVVLPGLLGKARYYHRPLNYKKLVEVGFTVIPFDRTLEQMTLKFHLAKEHQLSDSFRSMRVTDMAQVTKLLASYQDSFALHPVLSEDEAAHWLLPRPDILYSYVVEKDGIISDFISFYSLPSTVVHQLKHNSIKVAYLFYYAASSPSSLTKLVHAALVEARGLGFDVFNCVEIMNNQVFINDLQFGEGDGYLNYYLYNWKTAEMSPSDLAVVML